MRTVRFVTVAVIGAVCFVASRAQLTDAEKSAVLISHDYEVNDNITYKMANSYEAKLDVYRPREAKTPTPVVVMIHGGGWVAGTKEGSFLYSLTSVRTKTMKPGMVRGRTRGPRSQR